VRFPSARGPEPGCFSLLTPDLAGGGFGWFCVELQADNDHQGFPLVYQVPFDDQVAIFSLFGSDLMSFDELLIVFGPGRFCVEGSRSQENEVAGVGASIKVKGLI